MYRERFTQGFISAPPVQGPAASPSEGLRDYLRAGRFKGVRPMPLVRPVPVRPKRHVLVLQRGSQGSGTERGQGKCRQPIDFDADLFDLTVTPWRPGAAFALPAFAVSLVVVDFEDGLYVDTNVYPTLSEALPGVPVIILATCEGPIDRIVALELGADDFMSKPAHPRELQARAQAILRHMPDQAATRAANEMVHGGIHLDLVDRSATTERGRVKLCNVEFWLLHKLVEARGRPVARDDLVDCLETQVREAHRDPRAVDVIVSRLRRKVDMLGQESLICTVRGHGYALARD